MSIVELVKRTAVRRIVYVLVALALGWVGIGRAEAANTYVCTANPSPCSREAAYAECAARGLEGLPSSSYEWQCTVTATQYTAQRRLKTGGSWSTIAAPNGFKWTTECPAPKVWDDALKLCKLLCDPNGPPLAGGYMKYTGADPGYQTCSGDCEYNNPNSSNFQGGEVDGIKYVSLAGWIPSGASCTVGPNDGYTPPADADHDGKSDGNDPSPNNPGDSGGNGPGGPNGSGDGSGDGSGNGNRSSGGGDCGSRPSSSGDQIAAQIAYQTWATRCAIEGAKNGDGSLKVKVEGGTGTGTGTGGTTQQGNGTCGDGQFNATVCAMKDGLKKVTDWIDGLKGEVTSLDDGKGEDVEGDDAWAEEEDQEQLDASGYGWGSSCPTPPQISIPGGGTLDWGFMCTFAQLLGGLILAAGYVQAAFIIGKA